MKESEKDINKEIEEDESLKRPRKEIRSWQKERER